MHRISYLFCEVCALRGLDIAKSFKVRAIRRERGPRLKSETLRLRSGQIVGARYSSRRFVNSHSCAKSAHEWGTRHPARATILGSGIAILKSAKSAASLRTSTVVRIAENDIHLRIPFSLVIDEFSNAGG